MTDATATDATAMTAAPTGGCASPPQFDETSDKWPAYQVRLEAFFKGNGITEDKKKRALLVTAMSTHTVDVLSGRCAPDKAIAVMAAARIQRWALLLSAYDYVIIHQPGKDNVPADALSRLPTSATSQPGTQEETDAGGWTPAQLLMGYDLRSRLDNAVSIPPSPADRPFLDVWQPGEPVWVRNFGRGEPWTPASITSTDGARLVNADGPEGEPIRRHSDQVKPRELEHDQGEASDSGCQETAGGPPAGGTPRRVPTSNEIAGSTSTPVLRRSDRQRKPLDRYSP
ncbi:uncharacterized protein LOC144165103 [Haemaphysalis longicornis]